MSKSKVLQQGKKEKHTITNCSNCGNPEAKEYVVFQGIGRAGIINKVVYLDEKCHKLFLEGKLKIDSLWILTIASNC